MPGCAIKACSNYDKKHKKSTDNITFHRFPSDPVRHEAWCRVIRKERGEPYYKASGQSRVCSEHFKEDDFYSPGSRRLLKKSAIPSVKVQPLQLHTEEKETFIVKIEPHSSDDSLDDLNDSVKVKIEADASEYNSQDGLNDSVIVKIEPHTSDGLNGPVIVKIEGSVPENNSQNDLKDSVQVKIEDNSEDDLKDVDINDLEPIFDTPLEAALKRQIDKYKSINVDKAKRIKVLQRQNNRLMARNKCLKKIIKDLNSKGLIGTEIEAALGDSPELAAIFKLIR